MTRFITMAIVMTVLALMPLRADGGWVRAANELYAKLTYQMPSTTDVYDRNGTSTTIEGYPLSSIGLYAEYGVTDRLTAIVNAPFHRSSTWGPGSAVGAIGDVAVDVRYGVVTGDRPVSVVMGVKLPTGDETQMSENIHLPTGEGEWNVWLNAGASHSLWPIPAFVSADVGYNLRGIAVSDYTAQFDNGALSDQYRFSLKAGYQPIESLWLTMTVYRLGTAGTPVDGRFTFNGLGEGVEYNAWYIGAAYELKPVILSINASSAFTAPSVHLRRGERVCWCGCKSVTCPGQRVNTLSNAPAWQALHAPPMTSAPPRVSIEPSVFRTNHSHPLPAVLNDPPRFTMASVIRTVSPRRVCFARIVPLGNCPDTERVAPGCLIHIQRRSVVSSAPWAPPTAEAGSGPTRAGTVSVHAVRPAKSVACATNSVCSGAAGSASLHPRIINEAQAAEKMTRIVWFFIVDTPRLVIDRTAEMSGTYSARNRVSVAWATARRNHVRS